NPSLCAGDTSTGGYHVYSYLVQSGTDVSTVTFNGQPSAGYGILTSSGNYYGTANTAIGGQVVNIPNDFQWSQLTDSNGFGLTLGELLYTSGTSGAYEAGLVCADTNGHVTNSWSTPVYFT